VMAGPVAPTPPPPGDLGAALRLSAGRAPGPAQPVGWANAALAAVVGRGAHDRGAAADAIPGGIPLDRDL
jgi:hypothetical protein